MRRINRFILLCAAIAGLCACGGSQGYTIEGDAEGDYAVLNIWNVDGQALRDTAAIENGHFVFKGTADDVRMGEVTVLSEGKEPVRNFLYVENAHLKLSDGKFSGGPNNDFMREMDAVSASLDTAAVDYRERFQEAVGACIAEHPDVEAAAFMYYIFNRETPLEQYEEGFNRFTERVQNSFLGTNAREEIIARKATMQGIEAPAFTLNDRDGNQVSLESLRGQYVLLDFWASWCKPCRASMPGLKEIYGQYHDKGLEILGISIDTDAEAWKKAVEDDQTPWIHVLDRTEEKGKGSEVAHSYGVHAVPTYFLIDKDGRIIGKMEHDSLIEKLGELLD